MRKNDSIIKHLENATKKIISKENIRGHQRHSSMEVKYSTEKSTKASGSGSMTKNIHAMKEMLLNNPQNNTTKMVINKPTLQKKQQNSNPSNIILNQAGIPCFNNINIYTTHNSNNIKGEEINLRQYIFSQVNKQAKPKIAGPGHVRSASNNFH
jgi:hypothetical protein